MPGAKRSKHRFGGPWTEIKLEAIADYLQFYQSALRNMGFEPAPTTPEQYREFIRSESTKFAKIIVDAGVKLEP